MGASGNRLTASERLLASAYNTHAKTIDRVYAYDGVYRLTGETVNGTATAGAASYGYDPVGNRLARGSTLPGLGTQSFTFDANDRLNSDTYDPNGNTLVAAGFGQTQADRYDFENRLVRRQTAAGTVSIQYDGEGNRVGKIVTTATNTVVTLFVVDEQNPTGYAQVLEELESVDGAALAVSRAYTYGHTLISQDRRDGPQWQASFYGVDGHNNVRYLTDANGVVTDTYDYDAFGNLIAATGTTPNRYLYSGEQYDADLALYYLRTRYHNPDTGRFWSMDTYEGEGSDPGTLHKYTYCGNNPVNAWDPSGNNSIAEETMASATWGVARGLFGATIGGLTGSLASGYDALLHGKVSNGEIATAMSQGFEDGARAGFFMGDAGSFGAVGGFGVAGIGLLFSGTGFIASYQSFIDGNYSASAFEGCMASFGVASSVAGMMTAITSEVSQGSLIVTPNGYRNAVWGMGYKERGLAIETAWGGNLPPGFETFDRWHPLSKTATSIKSVDLDKGSYTTESQIYNYCSRFVNDIIDFDTYTKEGFTLQSNQIGTRALRIAIPRMPTAEQLRGMQQVVDYGHLNNVVVKFHVF